MPRKLIIAGRELGPGRRALVGAAVSLVVLPVGLGAALGLPGGGEPARPATPEPTLAVASDAAVDEPEPTRNGGSQPVVVEALRPGAGAVPEPRSEDGPPEHIRRQNVRLRRELAHLKAIQAESRRVARELRAAGLDTSLLVGSGQLIWPVNGSLSSPFGQRWGRLHAGIDIAAPGGTPIRAADSGQVILSGWQGGYGLYTCVQHTASLSTCYAHQSRIATSAGGAVRRGEVIGFVGNTGYSFGDHLHFETRVDGQPVDPLGFL